MKNKDKKVRPKKVKVRKKDKFKAIKKAIVPAYIAPQFLEKKYGIKQVSESGVFVLEDHLSNKLYTVSCKNLKDKQAVFDILRDYDFKYRFYYYKTDTYLLIQINTDENQDASFDFDAIEKDMFKKLAGLGIDLTPVNLEDRLRHIHQFIIKDKPDSNNNIMDYVHNVAAWKLDFELDDFILNLDCLEVADKAYQAFYFIRFGDDVTEMLQELHKIENIECIMVEQDGISDNYLFEFFSNNYMGCNNELRRLKKTDPKLYEILTDPAMRDTRSYSMVSINVLYSVFSSDEIDTVKEKIKFIIDRYDAAVYEYSGMMAAGFLEFAPFGMWNVSESRVVKNAESCKCLLFNCCDMPEGKSGLNKFFM